jgi:hypothetical protein
VPGRDFHVRLTTEADGGQLRVEVSDTRAERRPAVTASADPDAESGRGLLLVTAVADDRGVIDRRSGPGKTVWAVLEAASGSRSRTLRQALVAVPCRPADEPVATRHLPEEEQRMATNQAERPAIPCRLIKRRRLESPRVVLVFRGCVAAPPRVPDSKRSFSEKR